MASTIYAVHKVQDEDFALPRADSARRRAGDAGAPRWRLQQFQRRRAMRRPREEAVPAQELARVLEATLRFHKPAWSGQPSDDMDNKIIWQALRSKRWPTPNTLQH